MDRSLPGHRGSDKQPCMKRFFASLVSCFALCQCSIFTAGTNDGIDENPFDILERQSTNWKARSVKRVSVPFLRSPALQSRWGKPDLLVGPDGSYALRYKNPSNPVIALLIYGSPEKVLPAGITPPPYTHVTKDKRGKIHAAEVSQSWQHAAIHEKELRYCISEETSNDGVTQYTTETFRLTDEKGRSGSYRIRIGAGREGGPNDVKKLLKTLRLR